MAPSHLSPARHVLVYPMKRFGMILLLPLLLTQCETTNTGKTGKTGSYKSASYGSDRIATPAGHGMRKSEYPFDDDGAYRRDWVRDESRDRAGNSYASTAIASTGTGSRSSSARSNSGDGGASSRSETVSRRKPKSGAKPSTSPPTVAPQSADSTEFASYFGPGGQGTSSPSSASSGNSMSGPSTYAPSAAASTPPPTLVSYTPAPTSAPPAVAASPAPAPSATYHKVASGDTLYSLSRRYGSSVAEIKRINGLSSDTIRVGQSLRLP